MAFFKSDNPVLNKDTFDEIATAIEGEEIMTLQGTVNKTCLLLFFVIISALVTYNLFDAADDIFSIAPYLLTGIFGGTITGYIIAFNKALSPPLALTYTKLPIIFRSHF